jgi:prepilin-type N-terminal cleavage/methylation domain-containing protein
MKQPATRHQPLATRRSAAATPSLRFGCHGNPSPAIRPPVQVSSLRPLRKRSAFTLIELLVVIAIIAILAGLGFAGMQGAMESSRKAQARNDVHQIASAVKAYQLEYGRLPESGNVIPQLTGGNSKKVVFLEAKAAKDNKGGIAGGKMYDPWGGEYSIQLDDDYDNKMQHRGGTHFTTVIIETTPPGRNQKPINNVQ